MTLGLHSKCISRLKQSLAENLPDVMVNNEIFLDFSSTLGLLLTDDILPTTGPLYDRLQKNLGESPLYNFIYHTLSRELYENGKYDAESKGKLLNEFSAYKNLEALADRLVNDFNGLPWPYLVSFELPIGVGAEIRLANNSYPISSSLKIVTPDESYDSLYPLYSGIEERDRRLHGLRMLAIQSKQWNKNTAYIQIDTEGFIGSFGKTITLEDALGKLKSFIGLSLATRLVKVNHEHIAQPFGSTQKSRLIIHRKIGNKWEVWSTYEIPLDLSTTLNSLQIDDLDGEIKSTQLSSWIQSRLPKISTAFSNPDKAERVLLAAQWLLDSYVGTNELLSFVQTTVAMEIMLGEESKSDVVGIGELLRNRCAYLIGKSHSQREEILSDFDKIYSVRSKIVHRGKSRLTNDENHLFRKLQWMCRRVINEELELIAKDEKEKDPAVI